MFHPAGRIPSLGAFEALLEASPTDREASDRLRELYKTLRNVIIHELAIAHPQLDGKAHEELSFLFISMMHAHWSFVATLGYSSDHNRITRQAFDTLISSYVGEDPAQASTVKARNAR